MANLRFFFRLCNKRAEKVPINSAPNKMEYECLITNFRTDTQVLVLFTSYSDTLFETVSFSLTLPLAISEFLLLGFEGFDEVYFYRGELVLGAFAEFLIFCVSFQFCHLR